MGKAVKKLSIVADGIDYRAKFAAVQNAADEFEQHDKKGRALLNSVLAQIFDFGEQIRLEPDAFEAFLKTHGKPMNKVTQTKPYNALVSLAFSDAFGKSWISEMSTVLSYASEIKGSEPILEWLQQSTVSEWYAKAVKYFARTTWTTKQTLRSSRLEMITQELGSARVVAEPLPGVVLANGFHRSLIFAEGGQSFLVHINAVDENKTIEKYLIELAGDRKPDVHPLAEKALYRLFRAVDLIAGTCMPASNGSLQLIAIWNEASGEGSVTKLRFLSNAYSFTNATVTLKRAIPELDGKGQFAFELSDAEAFRDRFQHDYQWHIIPGEGHISLVDEAQAPTRLKLLPIGHYLRDNLKQGMQLTRKTRHFRATCAGMKASANNLDTAYAIFKKKNADYLSSVNAPKRLRWLVNGMSMEVGFVENGVFPNLSYPFLELAAPAEPIDSGMELSLSDIRALWKVASAYGEDLAGYIGDSDVQDAAFCIDHKFNDGDHFEYASPMVLGVSMTRTQVCEDFAALSRFAPPTAV